MGTATHVTHDSLRDTSVDTQNGAGREARRVTGEVERRTHDLVRDPASPEGEASLRLCLERRDVPFFRDVGHEGSWHDAVDTHLWTERLGETLGHRIHAGLGGGIRNYPLGRANRSGARHHDDRSAVTLCHPGSDEGGKPEHALHVETHDLVPHGFCHIGHLLVEKGHPRIVHEYVDPTELRVCSLHQRFELVPDADVARERQSFAASSALDLPADSLTSVDLAARNDDIRPTSREGKHHLASESAAPASDERPPPRQVESPERTRIA